MKCQQCDSTENVRNVRDFQTGEVLGLKCWDCRKDKIMQRTSQGGVDDRPVSGDWKESFKDTEQVGKKGDGPSGQSGLGDFV